ncbi:hypothetical protein IL306_001763 [Fusarium sp. DS 682]|nr:hypothetical protein IL306_001763 [Fusarium sp. DS 682]
MEEDGDGCCAGKRGVFLDSKGNIEDDDSSTTTSSSTTTVASTTISVEPSATSDEAEETTDNSQGMKIGLGVGIPAAAIIAALSVWLFLRRKSTKHQDQVTPASNPAVQYSPGKGGQSDVSQTQMYHQQYPQSCGHYAELSDQRSTESPLRIQELQG